MVLSSAWAARPLASRLEPALKPNQPTHSRQAPMMVKVRLCGGIGSLRIAERGPSMIAATRPATPALMCTTVPPAKSSAPSARWPKQRQPLGPPHHQTMCAIGR